MLILLGEKDMYIYFNLKLLENSIGMEKALKKKIKGNYNTFDFVHTV